VLVLWRPPVDVALREDACWQFLTKTFELGKMEKEVHWVVATQTFCISPLPGGNDPICLIFFKWVGSTTNQFKSRFCPVGFSGISPRDMGSPGFPTPNPESERYGNGKWEWYGKLTIRGVPCPWKSRVNHP